MILLVRVIIDVQNVIALGIKYLIKIQEVL